MRLRADFTFEAEFDDVTKGWTDEERQKLLDGDDDAGDAALSALVALAMAGKADEVNMPFLETV